MDIRPIRTTADYQEAVREIERLWDAPLGTPEGDKLDVLATLVQAYDDEHYPIKDPTPSKCCGTPLVIWVAHKKSLPNC